MIAKTKDGINEWPSKYHVGESDAFSTNFIYLKYIQQRTKNSLSFQALIPLQLMTWYLNFTYDCETLIINAAFSTKSIKIGR